MYKTYNYSIPYQWYCFLLKCYHVFVRLYLSSKFIPKDTTSINGTDFIAYLSVSLLGAIACSDPKHREPNLQLRPHCIIHSQSTFSIFAMSSNVTSHLGITLASSLSSHPTGHSFAFVYLTCPFHLLSPLPSFYIYLVIRV